MHIRYFAGDEADRRFVAAALADEAYQQNYHERSNLEAMRRSALAIATSSMVRQVPAGVSVTSATIAGVPCEWLIAEGADMSRLIVYLHGGGFVRGHLALQRANAALIAQAAGTPVLAIGYRQAPEHPFPAAMDDVVAVHAHLLESEGWPPGALTVVGESSGGCLALGLAVHLAELGALNRQPAGIGAVSPMVDLSLSGASWHYNARRDVADLDTGRRLVDMYLAGASASLPRASPVRHDFVGCCPLLISAGSHETMLSDAEFLARKAADAGTDVELHVHEAMPHGFTRFDTPIAREALVAVAHWCAMRSRGRR